MLDDPSKNDSSAMIRPRLLPPCYKREHSLWGENTTALFISLTTPIINFKLSSLIMTGRGEGSRARTRMATRSRSKTRTTQSARAGLQFPVARVHRHLRRGKYAIRIGAGAPVYLAAVLEVLQYLAAEILELAGNAGRTPQSTSGIFNSIQNEEELKKLMSVVIMGIIPNVKAPLWPA